MFKIVKYNEVPPISMNSFLSPQWSASSMIWDHYIPDIATVLNVYYSVLKCIKVYFYFEGFTSIPTALTANDRNRRIQVYQASDG